MKTQSIILASLMSYIFFFIGCNEKKESVKNDTLLGAIVDDENEQEIVDNENEIGIVDNVITAKVENASEFSNVVEVKLMAYNNARNVNRHIELARGIWKNDGFTIELPEMLDTFFLHPLVRGNRLLNGRYWPGIEEMQPTLTISNEKVNVTNNYFVGVDKYGEEVATFSFMKIDDGSHAIFTYVDSDVTISGYRITEFQAQPNWPWSSRDITTYSVNWKKGWNVWYFSYIQSVTDSISIREIHWSTSPISGQKWYGNPIELI